MSDREVVVDGEAVEATEVVVAAGEVMMAVREVEVAAGDVVVAAGEVVVAAGEVVVAVEVMAARETIGGIIMLAIAARVKILTTITVW